MVLDLLDMICWFAPVIMYWLLWWQYVYYYYDEMEDGE